MKDVKAPEPAAVPVESRLAQLERQVAQLRKVLKDFYDIDGRGFVG